MVTQVEIDAPSALPRRYQRHIQWLLSTSAISTTFVLAMVFTIIPRSSSDFGSNIIIKDATIACFLWLGFGLGAMIATIIAPQLHATRLLGSGTLLMATALFAWCLSKPYFVFSIACGGAGLGLALAIAGANMLSRLIPPKHAVSLPWIGGMLGSGIGIAMLAVFPWRVVLAGAAIPCLAIGWRAWRLPTPPTPLHFPPPWREIWLPPHSHFRQMVPILVKGVQVATLMAFVLLRPISSVLLNQFTTALFIAISFGVLGAGAWLASIINALWSEGRWWGSGICLCATLCWLLAANSTSGTAVCLHISALFLLGAASQPTTLLGSQGMLTTVCVPLLAGGIPWLLSYVGDSLPPTTVLQLYALLLAITTGILFIAMPAIASPSETQSMMPEQPSQEP